MTRGKRAKAEGERGSETTYVRHATAAHQRWAMLIKQVYEVDPLECPECGGKMKIIAFIKDPVVVYKILDHLDLLESSGTDPPRSPTESKYQAFHGDLPWGEQPFHVC